MGNNAARPPASGPSQVATDSGRWIGASQIVALSEAIKRNPNAADLYSRRAQEYQRAGKMAEALTDAERATDLAPKNVQGHLLYAQLLEKAHLENQALQEYRKVQSLKPDPRVLTMATDSATQLERKLSKPNR
jgi:tetratricopeptide (TPR) repeat protein